MDPTSTLQEFLVFMLNNLVDYPDEVEISSEEIDGGRQFVVKLNDDDVGRVIGRNGFTISALRSMFDAAGEKHGMRVRLKVFGFSEVE
ncbi:KH domain-containing protein [Sulfuriroseicoccus oceanibius]|uniref:RNA-binding protein KhpA n=1 Tax=Sulfuriroseicoccus oceanibius TaxID=2707525 RepID=A0A6B3L2H6_9BACT|nr:KH domain-containing protein [Sulfuriroseicoccus oceanibius]QQL43995.1 KH domain-containing protein [Sulfuriroseicoccus oceanibius]